MGFLSKGSDSLDRDVQEQMDRREKMMVRRVWVPVGKSINAVFLDDDPVRFEEYRIWKGQRPDFVTKPEAGNKDHFLAAGMKSDVRYAYTVIDCSKWTDKKGKEHGPEKKLLVVSPDVAKLLRDKKASWGGIKNKAVVIRRKGEKDSASGSDFELMMKNGQVVAVNMKAFKDVEPFHYEKILAPPSADESIRLLALVSKAKQNNEAISVDGDDPGAGAGAGGLPEGDPGPSDAAAPAGEMVGGDDSIPF